MALPKTTTPAEHITPVQAAIAAFNAFEPEYQRCAKAHSAAEEALVALQAEIGEPQPPLNGMAVAARVEPPGPPEWRAAEKAEERAGRAYERALSRRHRLSRAILKAPHRDLREAALKIRTFAKIEGKSARVQSIWCDEDVRAVAVEAVRALNVASEPPQPCRVGALAREAEGLLPHIDTDPTADKRLVDIEHDATVVMPGSLEGAAFQLAILMSDFDRWTQGDSEAGPKIVASEHQKRTIERGLWYALLALFNHGGVQPGAIHAYYAGENAGPASPWIGDAEQATTDALRPHVGELALPGEAGGFDAATYIAEYEKLGGMLYASLHNGTWGLGTYFPTEQSERRRELEAMLAPTAPNEEWRRGAVVDELIRQGKSYGDPEPEPAQRAEFAMAAE